MSGKKDMEKPPDVFYKGKQKCASMDMLYK